jgi:hypothetical protein
MNAEIARIDLTLPERWCSWRPGDGPRQIARAAADLTSTPVARARLRAALEAVDRSVVEQNARHVRVGAWVPDASGDVVAGLACELLVEAPEDPDPATAYLRRVQRKIYRSRRQATRLVHHAAQLQDLPAGGGVLTLRSHGVQRHEVLWTVFPPGARQAVELRFDTRSAPRYEELAEHAEQIATGLRVALAHPGGHERPPSP